MSDCNKSLIEYRYYDTPEGCDIGAKAFVTAKYGAVTGVILATHDVLMYSHASGWERIIKRYAYHTLPLVAMGASFAIVSNQLLKMRKKNDAINYFVGGFVCGPILAYYLGSYHAVLLGGIALGVAGAIKKDSIDKGYHFFPEIQSHRRTVWQWRRDYSLVEDVKMCPPCKTPSMCVIL